MTDGSKVDEKFAVAAVSSVALNRGYLGQQQQKVWQKEWDEAVIVPNKLHEILPELSDKVLPFCKTRKEDKLSDKLLSFCKTRKEDTVLMSTKRSLFYLHGKAGSNPSCSQAGIPVSGK